MSNYSTISAKTKLLCIIGHPISHTFSPLMHNSWIVDLKLPYVYVAFDISPNKLKQAVESFKSLDIKGINVTIPHKESIIPFLDKIEGVAKSILAINTIKNTDGVLIGRNTDAEGAKKALIDAGCKVVGKTVLVLGAGGAAKAICFALAKDAERIIIVNRTEKRALDLACKVTRQTGTRIEGKKLENRVLEIETKKADILINTTPIGMSPNTTEVPISIEFLHDELFVFDLIYNPMKTRLIKNAEEVGCKTLGGLDMLINQGALAFEWWTGISPDTNLIRPKLIKQLTS